MTAKHRVNLRTPTMAIVLLTVLALYGGLGAAKPSEIALGTFNSPVPRANGVIRGLGLPADVSARQAQIAMQVPRSPGGLPWNRTSDYMLGTVTVAIILPQCVGTNCTESWTTGEVGQVGTEVRSALQWWQQKAAEAGTSVRFQVVPGHPIMVSTSVEPINIPGGNSLALCGNEGVWIDEVMANLGFNNYPPTGNEYLNEVREYDNYLRQTYDTDWAFVVFVADASNDAITDYDNTNPDPSKRYDGRGLFKFTTCNGALPEPGFGVGGYGWITGPHMVMNNVNDGYQPKFMDGVAAMEIGHIFGAPDELRAPGACMPPGQGASCNSPWGYLSKANGNCNYTDPSSVPPPLPQTCMLNDHLSLMRSPEDYGTGTNYSTVNTYTYGHIGWWDSHDPTGNGFPSRGNGLPDTIDTAPSVTLSPYSPDPTSNRTPTYIGTAQDIPFHTTQPNYVDVTINKITAVQYRVNGGSWQLASPVDGTFDSAYEQFTFTPLLCQNGTYLIEVRATNSVGHTSSLTSDTLTISSTAICKKVNLPIMMKDRGVGTQATAPLPSAASATGLPGLFKSPLPGPNGATFKSPLPAARP